MERSYLTEKCFVVVLLPYAADAKKELVKHEMEALTAEYQNDKLEFIKRCFICSSRKNRWKESKFSEDLIMMRKKESLWKSDIG